MVGARQYIIYTMLACLLSHVSHVWLFATLWIVACQTPRSIGSSRQEYWSVLPLPSSGDFPNLGIEPMSPASPALQVDSLLTEPPGSLVFILWQILKLKRYSWRLLCINILPSQPNVKKGINNIKINVKVNCFTRYQQWTNYKQIPFALALTKRKYLVANL